MQAKSLQKADITMSPKSRYYCVLDIIWVWWRIRMVRACACACICVCMFFFSKETLEINLKDVSLV